MLYLEATLEMCFLLSEIKTVLSNVENKFGRQKKNGKRCIKQYIMF